ncbi:hypothetical protein ACN6K9_005260 [Streptomyces sp. SAS_267]|uniref:hypothetical protein n=1 Tax=Streptomyces sp. SAS_267 TaxID=3412750 RepID=UPI00403C7DD5
MGRVVLRNMVFGFAFAAIGALGWMLLAQAPTWDGAGRGFVVVFAFLVVGKTARDLLFSRFER